MMNRQMNGERDYDGQDIDYLHDGQRNQMHRLVHTGRAIRLLGGDPQRLDAARTADNPREQEIGDGEEGHDVQRGNLRTEEP